MSKTDPKFYLGDVVMFNSVWGYPDGAAEDVEYTIVEKVKTGGWQLETGINGHTKQISLEIVRRKPYDFILVKRGEITHDVYDQIEELKALVDMLRTANTANAATLCGVQSSVSTAQVDLRSLHEGQAEMQEQIDNLCERVDASETRDAVTNINNTVNKFEPFEVYVDGVLRISMGMWDDNPKQIHLTSDKEYAEGGIASYDASKAPLFGECSSDFVMPMTRGLNGRLTPIPGAYVTDPINITVNSEPAEEYSDFAQQLADHIEKTGRRVISEGFTQMKQGEVASTESSEPIRSTGGSSSYYDLPLSDKLMNKLFDRWEEGKAHIRTEELIEEAFDNDFDFGTAFKSLVRVRGTTKGGGKAGNDVGYECNKIDWSVNKIREKHS
ncbi:hypothetical protein PMW_228 [Pseudomonas phage phiPMW]|uniref:Uncharacterized protein n=1 Tax=Pseudomonas phage phiPMW TaxID=1815582 RepID=A0A1S5R1S0_9CAUD|nr:hypothetical protein FDG97_gp122 [Pseudomonas phage phiPMW]ANA49353.1 hypothetical protein PMW_228 [Pseudomonas phage phiPMW]